MHERPGVKHEISESNEPKPAHLVLSKASALLLISALASVRLLFVRLCPEVHISMFAVKLFQVFVILEGAPKHLD